MVRAVIFGRTRSGLYVESFYIHTGLSILHKCNMLIPARTDTIMFHDYILGKAEIRFIKGRVNFEVDGHKSKDPAPFPSMIVVFNGKQPTSAVKSITA